MKVITQYNIKKGKWRHGFKKGLVGNMNERLMMYIDTLLTTYILYVDNIYMYNCKQVLTNIQVFHY